MKELLDSDFTKPIYHYNGLSLWSISLLILIFTAIIALF